MKVEIHNLHRDTVKTVEGTPAEVEAEVLRAYPWLRSEDPGDSGDVAALLDHLSASQAYDAQILEGDGEVMTKAEPRNLHQQDEHVILAMLGYNHRLQRALEAAQFLAAAPAPAVEAVRQALWEADGDVEEAALLSLGLEASESNRKALRAVQDVSETRKAEEQQPFRPEEVFSPDPAGEDVAEAVRRAVSDDFLLPVKLGGKHSAGSYLARDQATGMTWLLKPGSGGQSPAAGVREEPASQSRREAAFWHVADAWGLGEYLPRSELVQIHGQAGIAEVAAIELLGWAYKTLDKVKNEDPGAARALVEPYVKSGIAHRWAVLDYVLGQTDRHAGNMMVHDGDVKLIDQGAAFAGPDFSPARDRKSFVPFYLRAWAPGKWSAMDAGSRLKYMPRLPEEKAKELVEWLAGLDAADLDKILGRYGINPQPAKARLARLRMAVREMPADLAVNRAWVET
jgi:hypothetical protein